MLTNFFYDDDDFFSTPFRVALVDREKQKTLAKALRPVMDVDFVETENEYSIHADLPGVEKSEIDIKIENGLCTISAEKKNTHENKTATSHVIERSYGKVQRSVRLPPNADVSSPAASFVNGVLELKIPKKVAANSVKVNIA